MKHRILALLLVITVITSVFGVASLTVTTKTDAAVATTTTLTISNAWPAINEKVTFTAQLKRSTSSGYVPLGGKNVVVWHYLNGVRYTDTTKTTGANGRIILTQSFGSPGQRIYYASFAGDHAYAKSMSVATRINVTTSRPSWGAVNDFTYVLQNISLTAIGATKFDAIVIDYSRDGSDAGRFTTAQINALKYSSGGPKRVLAYMSIGEAEDYRWYWNPSWDANHDGKPDRGAPSWLGSENPDWPGNYKVKYWDPGWQKIVHQYLAKIIAAGYDGAYLDIIDAYLYWGPGGDSGLNRATAEAEMVSFVKSLAHEARVTHGIAGFAIVPQNGEELSVHPDYVAVVTGIGEEDVWYSDNTPQPSAATAAVLAHLDVFKHAGKPVFVIDYVTKGSLIDDFYAKARTRGYVPYATTRDLDVLMIHLGHAPN